MHTETFCKQALDTEITEHLRKQMKQCVSIKKGENYPRFSLRNFNTTK